MSITEVLTKLEIGGKIMKENKLIAEFMGKEIYHKYHESNYHTSWDWLMPVIHKILTSTDGEPFFKFSFNVSNAIFENDRDEAYQITVEFIKEYN